LNFSDSEPFSARHRHKIEKKFSRPIPTAGKKIVNESRLGVVIKSFAAPLDVQIVACRIDSR
jgi:hypothetical protein